MSRFDSDAMNSREQSDMPPAPSYPSPNAAQMGQGAMQYYTNRQLTADELLSAELSRETSGPGLADGSSNGVHHGVLAANSGGNPSEMGRPSTPDQHQQQHMLQFTPGQQVGADPNHDLSYGDQSARRKRSKISRACDECRRKKVSHCFCPVVRRDAGLNANSYRLYPGPLRREYRVRSRNMLQLPSTGCCLPVQSRPYETRSQQRVRQSIEFHDVTRDEFSSDLYGIIAISRNSLNDCIPWRIKCSLPWSIRTCSTSP